MKKWFDNWIRERNDLPNKSVIVTNRYVFSEFADKTADLDDVAYISISASDECAKWFFYDDSEADHYLSDADNVLNLNFDDITEDVTHVNEQGDYVTYHAISEEQADKVIDFVERNMGRHIIVHCRAGRSRSQGICRAIYDCFGHIYQPNSYNVHNPCDAPNPDVFCKVKRSFYKKNGMFQ